MKKLLSILLCFAMIFGAFCAFPISATEDIPYSGGSGTEDDPYLISTPDDIREIRLYIYSYPSLWSRKVYYKLTNDITINEKFGALFGPNHGTVSPLFSSKYYGFHNYIKSEYTLESDFSADIDAINKWYERYREQYGPLYTCYRTECYGAYRYFVGNGFKEVSEGADLVSMQYYYTNGEYFYSEKGYSLYYKDVYRKAAFTGVFDGDGHTITTSGYLFGFIENGGVIKNLTVKGTEAGIAYSVGDNCTVSKCVLDSDWVTTDYETIGAGMASDYIEDEYEVISGAIAYNYGTVENCINYADGISGLVGQNYGAVKNCMNLGTVYSADDEYCSDKVIYDIVRRLMTDDPDERFFYSAGEVLPAKLGIKDGISCVDLGNSSYSKADDTLYTLDECQSAGGDKSAFAGLDFIYTWVMIDGMPYLRFACKGVSGDTNFDGQINAKDANQLKAVLALGTEGYDYRMIASFDVNVDEAINAKDSCFLKQQISGTN